MAFKLPNQKSSSKTKFIGSREEACPGTPLLRRELEGGALAEANDDGTIFVSTLVEPNSKEENQILMHEMVHMTHMKTGKLAYTDDAVIWNGEEYPREDGYITYEGNKYEEGSKEFPWEKMPWE